MSAWQQWLQHPQHLWVRKALFQIHLWMGIGIGLYVFLMSVSGSAIVYRRELSSKFSRKPVSVAASDSPLNSQELLQDVQERYPNYEIDDIIPPAKPDRPASVVLQRNNKRIERLFNPYTGEDLGDPDSSADRALLWLVQLHDNLLFGPTGRLVNGLGAGLVAVIALTGSILWWPGIKNWRRSATIHWKASFPRFNWDLHSAVGFWCSLFIFTWAISGIYFVFPEPFNALLNGRFTFWLWALHFGRFNWFTKIFWTIFGLTPAVLFVTGALMWWNRVLKKRVQRMMKAV